MLAFLLFIYLIMIYSNYTLPFKRIIEIINIKKSWLESDSKDI